MIVGGVPSSDVPATVQAVPVAEVIVASPQLRSSLTVADACRVPVWVGNACPASLPPIPHAPNPDPGTNPTANQPPTRMPNVAATTRPPTIAARVRWRISPRPMPMRISGHSCQT